MKPRRRLLISVATGVVVLAVALAVVASPAFQTWAARRYLARHPEWHVSLGRVAAGWHRIQLSDVTLSREGVQVKAPRIDAGVDLLGLLLRSRLTVGSVVARGWSVTVDRASVGRELARGHPAPVPPASAPAPAPSELRGLLAQLQLPLPTSLDGIDADGVVQSGSATAKVHLTGGGFGAGKTGTLRYTIDAERRGAGPTSVHVAGAGGATMGSARDFTQLELRFDAEASGGKLDHPVALEARVEVTRTGNLERYELALAGRRPLVNVTAELAEGARTLRGNWSVDLTDADVEPFVLGRPLPAFSASGAGKFDADTTFTSSHYSGTIAMGVDRLGVLARQLDQVGPIKLSIDTDVAQHGASFAISRLDANIMADNASVAHVRALQSFEFEPATRALRASDANAPLLGVTLEEFPLRWINPMLAGFSVAGRSLRGELTATPRAGGLSFATRGPLAVSHLSLTRDRKPLLADVDLALTLAGDYLPQGWQVECRELTLTGAAGRVLVADARAGRLAGPDQPLKATGHVAVDFAAARAQPFARSVAALERGGGALEFAATVGAATDLQSSFNFKNLATAAGSRELPEVKGTIRAAIDAGGGVTVNAPVQFGHDGRMSDLTVSGKFATGRPVTFEARLASSNLVWDDLQLIGGAFARPNGAAETDGAAVWSMLAGTAALDLKHVTAGAAIDLTNVTGTIRCGAGGLTLENIRGATTGGGEATVVAAIRGDSGRGVRLNADIAATELEAAPWFRGRDPRQPPTVEGRFTVTSKLSARAGSFAALSEKAVGQVECTSKGGVFRGLAVNVGNLVENSSKLSAWLAAAGDAIKSPFMGRKDQDEITSRAQAANELARLLSTISYDQLGVVVLREEPDVARVKEFTLISPELRIRGAGVARRERGVAFSHQLVDLDLKLRARGRTAELMKYLGILENGTDDLGYAACTIPVHVEGAVDRPDATQFSNRLVALAVEKTGLTEKAVDWINRLRGKSAN